MRAVTTQFLKNPDVLHWGFRVRYLGEDRFGHWLAAPTGTERWKGEEHVRPTREDAVFCAPRDDWWHLHYTGDAADVSHFVDIATPPTWVADDRYEMIDLDLDVLFHRDGAVEIDDEDEFEAHKVRYSYSDELISGALEATATVVGMLERREEPFFEVAAAWLEMVTV